jgi:hypothetical protein
MVQYKRFLVWTLLVWLNSAVSFYFAVSGYKQPADILGIIGGVFTFVAIYTAVDYHLDKIKAIKLRESLVVTAIIKALTQFYPAIEMFTGILSTEFIRYLSFDQIPFISTYLITVTDGILLSIVIVFFILIRKFFTYLRNYISRVKV